MLYRIQRALQNPGGGGPVDDFAATCAAQVGLADQQRSTAAVESRSSQNAAGRGNAAARLRANCRTDWQRRPSRPFISTGRPMTSPPTSSSRANPRKASRSPASRVLFKVRTGLATDQLTSDSARPMVFEPTSRPSRRRPGGTRERSRARPTSFIGVVLSFLQFKEALGFACALCAHDLSIAGATLLELRSL